MSSKTQSDNRFTLLIATYAALGALSDFPISIHALGSMSPWLLCMIRAHAGLSGNCCFSIIPLSELAVTVT